MTHVKTRYLSYTTATVTLECGHVQFMGALEAALLRPGSSYDCPDCRAQQAQALAEQFTPVELARLRLWRWMRRDGVAS